MPESLVVNLVSEAAIPRQYLRGYHLHRLFLALVSAVDVDLGQSLQTSTRYQPFTLSPLQIASQLQPRSARNLKFLLSRRHLETTPVQYASNRVPAGSHCWWRIALLNDALFADISTQLERTAARQPWYLGPARLHMTNFSPPIPEWTSCYSYQQLYEQASSTNRYLNLQLVTPAVFRQSAQDSPLPTRDAVFHSLRRSWNRYSGLVFAPDIVNPIVAHSFELKTVSLPVGNNETVIGCLGELTFHIVGTADPLIIKRINALVSFSRYCGIGYKTYLGLGMVRIVTGTQ